MKGREGQKAKGKRKEKVDSRESEELVENEGNVVVGQNLPTFEGLQRNIVTPGVQGYPLPGVLNMIHHTMGPPVEDTTQPSSADSGKGKRKRPSRRGPMDSMRQLVRILLKLFPHSAHLIPSLEEYGGANRITETQIREYLSQLLGNEAPHPEWGVPHQWYAYIAELFQWCTGRPISPDSVSKVVKREPGRSWEIVDSELGEVGVHPNCWPLPLTREGVRNAEENPYPQPIPPKSTPKKPTGVHSGTKKMKMAKELDMMDELDLWKLAMDVLQVAQSKQGSSQDQQSVELYKMQMKQKIEEIIISSSMGMFQLHAPTSQGMLAGTLEQQHGNFGMFMMQHGIQPPATTAGPNSQNNNSNSNNDNNDSGNKHEQAEQGERHIETEHTKDAQQ